MKYKRLQVTFRGSNLASKFVVNFWARPAVKISGKVEFLLNKYDIGDIKLTAQDIFVNDSAGIAYPTGIQVSVELWAISKEEAIEKARGWASGLVSIASFVSDIGMPSFHVETAYDLTPNAESRDFVQFFYDFPIISISNGQLPPELFSDCFGKLIDGNTKHRDRLQRAIGRYSKSITEANVIDQFSSIWIGFEALNEALREKLNAPDEISKCPECGHEHHVSTLSGVKHFIIHNSPEGPELFKRGRRIRVDILHSTKNLEGILPEIASLVPSLRAELRRAVFFLLDLRDTSPVREQPITNVIPIFTALEAKIVGAKDVVALRNDLGGPHIEIMDIHVESHVEQDQTVSFSVQPKIIARVTDSAKFEVYASSTYRERGKIKSSSFKIP